MSIMAAKIQKYEEYLLSDPDNPYLLITLGDSYHKAGQFSLAETCYVRAKEFSDKPDVLVSRIGNLKLSQGDTEGALIEFERLIASGDNSPVLFHNIGVCLFAKSDFESAKNTFESLVNVDEVARSSEFYLASIDDTLDKPQEALKRIDKLLKEGNELFIRGYRAVLLYNVGQIENAIAEAKKILSEDSNNSDSWSVMGTMHLERAETENAKICFQRIIDLSPGDARGWHGMGLVNINSKDFDEAISYFQKAVILLPNSCMMLMSLAWAYYCNEAYKESEEIFNKVLSINPNFAEAWGGLSCSLIAQGRIEEAEKANRKSQFLSKECFSGVFSKSILLKIKGKKLEAEKMMTGFLNQETRQGQKRFIDLIEDDIKRNNSKTHTLLSSKVDRLGEDDE